MKKWIKILSATVVVASLAACSDDSSSVDEPVEESTPEAIETEETNVDLSEEKGELTEERAKEIVEEYALGEGDTAEVVSFEDGVLFYKMSLAPNDLLPLTAQAQTAYSRLGDELFQYTGWKTLKVEFVELNRTVSFDYDEYEENEYGLKYFPSLEIEERLK